MIKFNQNCSNLDRIWSNLIKFSPIMKKKHFFPGSYTSIRITYRRISRGSKQRGANTILRYVSSDGYREIFHSLDSFERVLHAWKPKWKKYLSIFFTSFSIFFNIKPPTSPWDINSAGITRNSVTQYSVFLFSFLAPHEIQVRASSIINTTRRKRMYKRKIRKMGKE